LSDPVFIPFNVSISLLMYYAYCIHCASALRLTADRRRGRECLPIDGPGR